MKLNKKKWCLVIIVLLVGFFIFLPITQAADLPYDTICSDNNFKKAARVVGYVVQIARWVVPLLIIVFGMVDFGKAVVSNDDKAVSKASASLIRRMLAGVIVFFIPTLVLAILNAVEVSRGMEDESNSQFGACTKCIFDPFGNCPIS